MVELWHLVADTTTINETSIMLAVLGLIDVVVIANLLIMVIIGAYETFVSRLGKDEHPDRPGMARARQCKHYENQTRNGTYRNLFNSFIEDFIGAHSIEDRVILWQVAIHVTLFSLPLHWRTP